MSQLRAYSARTRIRKERTLYALVFVSAYETNDTAETSEY